MDTYTYKACLVLLGLVATICGLASSAEIELNNPVRSAAEDEIKSLPGLNYTLNFRHYSGYVEADDKKPTNKFWHYWFTESQSEPDKDPLVLWLNGGPGCSSLLGLLTELGPYSVNRRGEIQKNPFAWNKRANVVFMESPAGVGFSYAVDGSLVADDDSTARANHLALRSFLRKFPQFKNRPLFLTGESYGGVYLPTLGVLVEQDPELNLKGVAIGNGYLNANKLAESLIYFSYYHGLIGATTWKGLSRHCCGGKPPARGDCKFTSPSRSSECNEFVNEATTKILDSGLNPYNLYDHCAQSGNLEATKSISRENFDKSLMINAVNQPAHNLSKNHVESYRTRSSRFKTTPQKFQLLRNDPPCTDESITINYLNRADVKQAIHIPEKLSREFSTCAEDIQYTMIYPGRKEGLAPQVNALIDSPRNLTLVVYNGDTDMMCNFFGDEWFVDDLGREVIADYAPWHLDNQVAGFVKHYEGITFMTVKGSGHMVPTDRPAEALQLFNIFLYGHRHA